MNRLQRTWLLDAAIVAGYTLLLGYLAGAWTGFPKGTDAYAHLTKIKYILDFFPHHEWHYQWAAGMPGFLFYAPLPYYAAALFTRLTGFTMETSLVALWGVAYILLSIGLYGFVRTLTGGRLAALVASCLAMSSPGVWNWVLYGGGYLRSMALGFMAITLWAAAYAIRQSREGKSLSKRVALIVTITLSLTMQVHILIAMFTVVALGLLLLLTVSHWRSRLLWPIVFPISAVLPAAYVYLPLLFSQGASRFIGAETDYLPTTLNQLVPWFALDALNAVSPLLLPVLVVATGVMIGVLRRGESPTHAPRGAVLAIAIMSAAFLIYGYVGYLGYPDTLYINGFIPGSAIQPFSIFAAILTGLLLGHTPELPAIRFVRPGAHLLAIAVIVATSWVAMPIVRYHVYDSTNPQTREQATTIAITVEPEEKQRRFATLSADEAVWFNYRYQVPQTRDYFSTGILIPDWRAWLEQAVWAWKDNLNEVYYLLDWFAIKWFTTTGSEISPKYSGDPGAFQAVSRFLVPPTEAPYEFEYRHSAPLLMATDARTFMAIGGNTGYHPLFRALSQSNFNSQYLVPVRGSQYIDDHSLSELSQFDAVILYRYKFRDQAKAFSLLASYVRNGGGLIVEANGSPFDNSPSIPEPIPVSRTTATNYGTSWNFTSAESPVTDGIDFSAFGPAIYDNGPWGVSSTEESAISYWARPVLWTNEHPIVVTGEYGKGRVVWTGMNFPYHANSYRNAEESRFLAQMIEWVTGNKKATRPDYEAQFVHPQKRAVTVKSPGKGVLFKESYFPNWHAYVSGKETPIYRAGPDLMYAFIPAEATYPLEVTFEYKRSALEWLAIVISLAALVGLVNYGLSGRLLAPLSNIWDRRVIHPIKEWLQQEVE